jgi:predicted lipoprotein with Yx(FWY)xxD motif
MLRSPVLRLAAAVAAALALTACGAGEDLGGDYSANPAPVLGPPPRPGDSTPVPAPSTPAPAPQIPATPPAGGVRLTAQEVPQLGTVVTESQGLTLYRFDRDTSRPPAATCVDACAADWPPLVVDPEGALVLDGVDRAAVGMVQRPDGSSQLTIGGWPVYRYAGDTVPGATGGQGMGGTWFAVTPGGGKAG